MGTDIRGLYENNRRRETNAVTVAVPFVLEEADLREGTAPIELASGDYTGVTIPAGVIIDSVELVVDDAFDGAGSTIAVGIGGTSVLTATSVTAEGLTGSTGNVPMLLTSPEDVVATMVIAGTGTKGVAKIVIRYTDYDRATMSYIGEQ